MARRSRRSAKRKKKPDQTTLIAITAAIGFLFAISVFVMLSSSGSEKKKKPRTSNPKNTKSYSTANNEAEKEAEYIPSKRGELNRTTAGEIKENKSKNISAIPKLATIESSATTNDTPQDDFISAPNLEALPSSVTLPDIPAGEYCLTEGHRFSPQTKFALKLHSMQTDDDRQAKLSRVKIDARCWTVVAGKKDIQIAEFKIKPDGIFFQWRTDSSIPQRTLLRNSKLTISADGTSSTIQLRPIKQAPQISLFSRDAQNQYSFRLIHAPEKIYWALEPTNKNLPPFNFPTVGAPTTDGPLPLEETLEWTPQNTTGTVKARYTWNCAAKPGIKSHEKRIFIKQKKEYKIGDARWRPLTTESLKDDFDSRLEKYDNVVAGIKRKIIKGKYPSAQQIAKLREMIREGAAFADVQNFYYEVPDRQIRLEFRSPCDTTDTLLAQHPLDADSVEQYRTNGMHSEGTSGEYSDSLSPSNEMPEETQPATHADELWTIPAGQNPWATRQQQLQKMTGEKNKN